MEKEITIRLATREDAALIESFIRKLATYEDALYRTTVTPELVEEWMFEKQKADGKKNKKRMPSMPLHTSFGLSLKNLFTKKGRTLLTAFAGSIGIIGIAG